MPRKVILFMFLDIAGESNEGVLGVKRVAHKYRVSTSTASNYFRCVLFALYKNLDAASTLLIICPSGDMVLNLYFLIQCMGGEL